MSKIIDALVAIQTELKSPKDQNAGRYRYRNIEDINEAVKPLAAAHGCAVVYSDVYENGACKASCSLTDGENAIEVTAFALVNTNPKGMSIEQACGAASSYARKYAACGLFAIDSSEKDPDRVNADDVPIDANVVRAKKRLWDAITKWCELRGKDPKQTADEVKRGRFGDYEETAETLNKIAEDFEGGCHVE